MTVQNKATIKSYFVTGAKPTQAQFVDLIDSYLDVSAATNGTVTSVALSMPDMFKVTGSPITSAGTFTVVMSAQAQRSVFAAPVSAAGVPVFRTLVGSDIPDASLASAKLINTAVSAGFCHDFLCGLILLYQLLRNCACDGSRAIIAS